MKHEFECIIVGSGGAGLYSALETSANAKTAVFSKLYPRPGAITGAAAGRYISAALGNREEDKPEWHAL